jgi:proline racemase
MSIAMRRAQAGPVIVIFGAGHAPAHCEFLARNRFTETEVSWLKAMSVANPKGEDRERVLADPAEAEAATDTPMVGQR